MGFELSIIDASMFLALSRMTGLVMEPDDEPVKGSLERRMLDEGLAEIVDYEERGKRLFRMTEAGKKVARGLNNMGSSKNHGLGVRHEFGW